MDNGKRLSEEKRKELKKKLRSRIEANKIQRTNKKGKDELIDKYCKDNNLDRKMIDEMAKKMSENKK